MFFECRAMFLALQGKNGLSDGFCRSRERGGGGRDASPRATREPRRAAEWLSKATFLLAFSLRAANMVERFFFREVNLDLSDGGDESEWAGHR
jgi:hypothetical protein